MTDRPQKTIAESRIRLSQMMGPENANGMGNVHGGIIMKMADEAGAIAAMRHAQSLVVTVTVDSMTFMEPIFVGYVVSMDAQLTYVGSTSMEVRVDVTAENPITGACIHTNTAYFVYVAIDEQGKPRTVPRLAATTEAERQAMQDAQERQDYRKLQRSKEALRKDTPTGHPEKDGADGQKGQ